MKVKREVRMCDICHDNPDDYDEEVTIAKNKCKLCDKDLCESCNTPFTASIGDDDEDYIITEIDSCLNCRNTAKLTQRKDKKFIDDISKQIIHYLKQKVMLKEIEK